MADMTDRRRALARTAWRTLSSREAYANPWIRVREDVAEMPDGRTTLYGVVECAPCVGVLPFADARTVILVGQYRYVARDGDDTEFIEVRAFDFDEVMRMVDASEIRDAMTVVAVLHAARRR